MDTIVPLIDLCLKSNVSNIYYNKFEIIDLECVLVDTSENRKIFWLLVRFAQSEKICLQP